MGLKPKGCEVYICFNSIRFQLKAFNHSIRHLSENVNHISRQIASHYVMQMKQNLHLKQSLDSQTDVCKQCSLFWAQLPHNWLLLEILLKIISIEF